ncbi:MAG: single-stranded DNA-binding protein [Candidatus Aminicenantes bacterium]|nr:MAG: single-stranded DNA-binding protein [Candidatus Aminicenantes bacterium]
MNYSSQLITAAQTLCEAVSGMYFSPPVAMVYNPLDYARESHSLYLSTYGNSKKKVVFLGMNPGPWGMAQTGVPFGEINAVKYWLGINAPVHQPKNQHPKRPIEGFQCIRSEISGLRLWGLFKERFIKAEYFFEHHFVANYCPLVFMEASGRNRTPNKLKAGERQVLFQACDRHLQQVVRILAPQWLIGVGKFTEERARTALKGKNINIGNILHPSPASPAANRDWAGTVTKQMMALKIWL